MDSTEVQSKIEAIMQREPRYRREAYTFVANAVTFTVGRLAAHRHVSARELLEGMRDYARHEFGVLAGNVLHEWGIRSAADAGTIVYLLIEGEVLAASAEDRPEDFNIDFALAEAPRPHRLPALPRID